MVASITVDGKLFHNIVATTIEETIDHKNLKKYLVPCSSQSQCVPNYQLGNQTWEPSLNPHNCQLDCQVFTKMTGLLLFL